MMTAFGSSINDIQDSRFLICISCELAQSGYRRIRPERQFCLALAPGACSCANYPYPVAYAQPVHQWALVAPADQPYFACVVAEECGGKRHGLAGLGRNVGSFWRLEHYCLDNVGVIWRHLHVLYLGLEFRRLWERGVIIINYANI